MSAPIDSIPRVTVRDLLIALGQFESDDKVTLENLRLKFCYDRKATRKGEYMFPTVVSVAGELQKLGLIADGPLPKASKKTHRAAKDKPLAISDQGKAFLRLFGVDRGTAYDDLFSLMYRAHRNLQAFVAAILDRPLLAPVATSVKDHVGSAYGSSAALAAAVAAGSLDVDEMLRLLAQRIGRSLSPEEIAEVRRGIDKLVKESALSAVNDDVADFAKTFLPRLNDVLVPAVLRADGLGFDYRTHRTLWSLGPEFKLWDTTTWHPEHDGTLVFRTATIVLSDDRSEVRQLEFDSGLARTREKFLTKLFAAYQKLQGLRRSNVVSAFELRAIFCFDNRCQQTTFNFLFEESYAGSEDYDLHLEIPQTRSREKPLRAGKRAVGTIAMTARRS